MTLNDTTRAAMEEAWDAFFAIGTDLCGNCGRTFDQGFLAGLDYARSENERLREALEQIDEWGFRSYGHAIQVGVAMHVPRQPSGFLGSAQMVHQGRDEPFTDSNVGIESSTLTMLKVVFDCDDGIMPV